MSIHRFSTLSPDRPRKKLLKSRKRRLLSWAPMLCFGLAEVWLLFCGLWWSCAGQLKLRSSGRLDTKAHLHSSEGVSFLTVVKGGQAVGSSFVWPFLSKTGETSLCLVTTHLHTHEGKWGHWSQLTVLSDCPSVSLCISAILVWTVAGVEATVLQGEELSSL